ncbi:MAG: DUF4139 domain-containing protein [Cyclobacteriaceae bacterium]|nr:DUF4139 domain-containing protein [Cyclobacteriaceae bacterium]
MKKLWILMCLLAGTAMAQTEKTAESFITQVTVFLNRAQVHRQVKSRVEPGRNILVVRGLPAALDPQSIQVRGQSRVMLLGVSHRQSFLNEFSLPPGLKKLKDSVAWYNRQLLMEQQQKEVLNKEEQFLLANQRIGGANQNLSVNELKAMADYFRSRINDIGVARLRSDEKINLLKERLDKLNRQIKEQNELYSRNTSEIVISLTAEANQQAELELSYIVSDAGWYPVYDIRAVNSKSPVQLHCKAGVHQRTGEDWNQVKLKLSTANPVLGGLKPELAIWYVDFLYPALRYSVPTRQADKKQAESLYMELPPTEQPQLSDYTQVIQTSVSTEFEIGLPYTITSAAQPVTVDIQKYEVPATYRYATVPKMDRDAFLMAQITGWSQYNLLPGEAQVFFEGTYVGKTFINPEEVNDTLKVSLGRDPRIVVKREQKKDFTTRKTVGSNIRETSAWEISLRNTRNEPVTLIVEDQVPVSRNSQIEVTLTESGGAQYIKDTGTLVWELTLQPNEARKLNFAYEVKYPKGRQINY